MTTTNVLIIGNGGREHALAWKVAQSPLAQQVFVAPGNAGTARETNVSNIDIAATDIPALLEFAKQHAIGLTIVGPEAPLCAGIVNQFQQAGLPCFGPTQEAAQLEASKLFSKTFMQRHKIPTANYAGFTDTKAAYAYLETQSFPVVIKADGLAAGKGVFITQTMQEAQAAVNELLKGNTLGQAGKRIIIEEYLVGEEASFIVITDGKNVRALSSSQDHKARDNGDKGPNTGGMGAYSPAPVVTKEIHDKVMRDIVYPTIEGMAADGCPYQGFLYVGLMITPDSEAKVLEYNCRLGDPETQPLMMRLDTDLVRLCQATLSHTLAEFPKIMWNPQSALGVVLTAAGYPTDYAKNQPITGLDKQQDEDQAQQKIFIAGATEKDGQLVTSGGRVLCASALGATITEARDRAYALAKTLQWAAMHYRTDIGYRAIARESREKNNNGIASNQG